jgi:hypothetical protein
VQHLSALPAALRANSVDEDIIDWDREVFGADRSVLLHSIATEHPEFVLQTRSRGKLTGYSFGRRGDVADHLGPWVAQDESSARDLLEEFLLRSSGQKVFVDVMKSNPWAMTLLRERGFQHSRSLTRMYRGRNDFPGRPELQGAILGPEFG